MPFLLGVRGVVRVLPSDTKVFFPYAKSAGITSFKSRSFADWQKSGGKNLFPVDPKKVKDPKDIPYMQRPGGSADDADIKKGGGSSFFGGKKKAAPKKKAPAPAPEKKTNWWTL